jgi:endonuclease YncB( thermonuclease family)
VFLRDGTHANHTLVKDGWCWWYRKYAPGDTVLEGLEKEAREGRKGVWADPQPVPPWEWRKKWAKAAGFRRSGRDLDYP